MYYLVVCPLHKSRIDITEHLHPLCCKPGAECNGMLFANSHIKCTVGHFLHHIFKRTSAWHGGGNSHYLIIFFCKLYYSMTKYILVFGRLGQVECFLIYFSSYLIKQTGG